MPLSKLSSALVPLRKGYQQFSCLVRKVHSSLSAFPRYLSQTASFDSELQVFKLTLKPRRKKNLKNLLHLPFFLFSSPFCHVLLFNTQKFQYYPLTRRCILLFSMLLALNLTLYCPTSLFIMQGTQNIFMWQSTNTFNRRIL